MAEGSPQIVPIKVANAAQRLLDYMDNTSLQHAALSAYLQGLVDAPHFVPAADPSVLVRFDYTNYRQGSFTSEARIPLSTYLIARIKNWSFSWGDVLGKHSEIDCNAGDFGMEFSFLDDDDPEDPEFDYDCSERWREALSADDDFDEEENTIITEQVEARLAEKGPFLPDTPFDVDEEVLHILAQIEVAQAKRAKTE